MKQVDAIVFDMDGTIADLYSVENWEPKLRAEDASPYRDAAPLVNMEELRKIVQTFASMNIRIITVSWGAMNSSREYGREVRKAKKDWLAANCPELLEELHVVKYGTDKYSLYKGLRAVLVDDNEAVRGAWPFDTIDASNGLEMLQTLTQLLAEVKPRVYKAECDSYGKQGYKTIPAYPNYACTRAGKVINRKTGNEVKPRPNKHGRMVVNLNGCPRSLHRVVAMTWCAPDGVDAAWRKAREVHHINHNPLDNRASNLVWREHPDHITEHRILTEYLREKAQTDEFTAYREQMLAELGVM